MAEVLTTKEKGDRMIEWAQKVQCPKEIRFNDYILITDSVLMLSTQISTMQSYPIGNPMWVAAYMRIMDLKVFLTSKKSGNGK